MVDSEEKTLAFLQNAFAEYYAQRELGVPDVHKREFGFGNHKKIDFRHRSFSNSAELNSFLRKQTPLFASYSTALYEFPDARPMQRKVYLGSDLVFDLDKPSREFTHEKAHNEVFCVECLSRVLSDAVRVRDFLREDFGFKEFTVNYSGNKGFHFHLRSPSLRSLSQDARRQLVEYLAGPESLLSEYGEGKSFENVFKGPSEYSFGWGKRFYDHARAFIQNASIAELKENGLRGRSADDFFARKGVFLEQMARGKWAGVPKKFWDYLYSAFKRENGVGVDAHVTLDLARLIRIPGTLHGDSGLAARGIASDRLEGFKPGDAIAFPASFPNPAASGSGESERTINVLPHSDIALVFPENISLEKGVSREVSLATGVFLLCKRKAVLA